MLRIKGRISRKIQMEVPELCRKYWSRHFWTRDYFCSISGVLNEDTMIHIEDNIEPVLATTYVLRVTSSAGTPAGQPNLSGPLRVREFGRFDRPVATI
jgi:hypothetical protein